MLHHSVGWRGNEIQPKARIMWKFAVALALLTTPAQAVILDGQILRQNGQGKFVKLDTDQPLVVGFDTFDDDNLYGFDEDQNITLIEPIRVDIGGKNGLIPQGSVVASHYVFFDRISGVQEGFVYFDAPILGIAAYQGTMGATDFLADNAVTYISAELRGLEEGDRVWIDSEDPHKLGVLWAGSSPGDYIRVFTEQSPNAFMM